MRQLRPNAADYPGRTGWPKKEAAKIGGPSLREETPMEGSGDAKRLTAWCKVRLCQAFRKCEMDELHVTKRETRYV